MDKTYQHAREPRLALVLRLFERTWRGNTLGERRLVLLSGVYDWERYLAFMRIFSGTVARITKGEQDHTRLLHRGVRGE
jgi:hypothetical protein